MTLTIKWPLRRANDSGMSDSSFGRNSPSEYLLNAELSQYLFTPAEQAKHFAHMVKTSQTLNTSDVTASEQSANNGTKPLLSAAIPHHSIQF
jgi:hypothetical protein